MDETAYPEMRYGGFSRVDGTVAFFTRVQSLIHDASVVVDAGCGRGARQDHPWPFRRKLTDLRSFERRVIGLDVSDAGARNAVIDEFRLIVPGERWPIEDGSVDAVVSDYVLEHLSDPEEFFTEVNRILRPKGFFCARTPNKWGYVALVSAALPNRKHAAVVSKLQLDREEVDVFPTVYRANTRKSLLRLLHCNGLDGVVLSFEGEPNYLKFSPFLYRLGARLHVVLPPVLRSTLLVFAQKT